MPVLRFVVPPEWDGRRLAAFLRGVHGVSAATLRTARRIPGGLTMDGTAIRTVDPVRAGAQVAMSLPDADREQSYRPYAGALAAPVLYRDDDLIVLDKPAGMPCHPSKGHPDDTLANCWAALPGMAGRAFRPVGRLDRNTSGAVLCACHPHSAYWFGLGGHRPDKTYLALLDGDPGRDAFTVDLPLTRDGVGEDHRRLPDPDGLPAVTHCRILRRANGYCLAVLRLETGRTHQIRAHMAAIGCPLAGDLLYGGSTELIGRQALHCWRIAFQGPFGGQGEAVSPLPEDFRRAALALFSDECSVWLAEKEGIVSW